MKLSLIKLAISSLLILAAFSFVAMFILPAEWGVLVGVAIRLVLMAVSFASYRFAERIYKGNLATGK